VKSGLLRSYFTLNNKETTTFFARPGTLTVDLHSFLRKIPSNESIKALEDSEVFYIKSNSLYNIYEGNWKWQQVGRLLMEHYFVESEERTIRLQSKSAHELYEYFVAKHPDVVRLAPLAHIASYLGMTPETLSRVRRGR
jgi:CRP-like cAMP-binding protein